MKKQFVTSPITSHEEVFYGMKRKRGVQMGPASLLLALLAALLLPGCRTSESESQEIAVVNTGPAILHAVHSDQLKAIMAEVRRLTFDRMPQELGRTSQQDAHLREVSSLAKAMANAAGRIPSVIDDLGLTENEKQVFSALARRLQVQSATLGSQAERLRLAATTSAFKEISATCIACHTLFRDPSSPVPSLQ